MFCDFCVSLLVLEGNYGKSNKLNSSLSMIIYIFINSILKVVFEFNSVLLHSLYSLDAEQQINKVAISRQKTGFSHLQLIMAKNIMNHLKTALKIVAIGGLSGTILGYGYLQYISSVIGPISLNREQAISFYQDKYQYSDTKAKMTYYFALWNLSVSRILEYHSYVGYCDRLNRKIISYSLKNYQNAKIQQQIEKAGNVNKNKGLHQKIYMKIQPVRRKNAQNIADRQFIIKRIMQYQRQLNTSVLPNIPIQKLNRVEKIYRYLIDVGLTQQKPQLQAKFSKLLNYEKKHPKDTIHKILLI